MPLTFADDSSEILGTLSNFFDSRQCPAYLVGGFLRDSLLSRPSKDIDLAVRGDAPSLGQELAGWLSGTYIPLSSVHGVSRIVIGGDTGHPWTIDLSGFSGSIEQDLHRRDFTIDALALPLENWRPARTTRCVVPPPHRSHRLECSTIGRISPEVFDGCAAPRLVRRTGR